MLVTGGAGFVGSTTAATLLEAGHEVLVADDLSAGHHSHVPAEATFVEVDVTDPTVIDAVIADSDLDACIHFAGLIEAGSSMRDAARYLSVNTAGALSLLESLHRHGVERFVFSSTAAVYGEPVRTPVEEDDPTVPTNPYGESKLLVERALRWYAQVHGFRTAVLRYFNAAGATPGRPERHDPETHLIPRVLDVAAGTSQSVQIFGDDYATPDGTAVRDYVHVADLAAAHVAALERVDELETLTCNLGTGRGFSVLEVVDAARRVTGRTIPTITAPRRPGDVAALVASSSRAADLLDWRPERSTLEEIVADAWAQRVT